nr:hypothetical protein [Tanacetum cinerariifolium]
MEPTIAPYDQPLAITTTNIFEVSHEDTYDSDVDEGPHAATTFMANLSSTSGTNGATISHVNEVHIDDNQIFDNVNHMLAHKMHQEEHLDSDVESDIDDNTISYHQYQLDSKVQDVPTEDGHALLKPTNTHVRVHDSEESLVQAEFSRTKMSNRPGPLGEELHSNCVRENSKVIELEAEILKQQQMLAESDKRCSFIQKNHIDLQIKFRNYKECLKNQTIGDNSHSPAVKAEFEINQLKEQLQGKDDAIRKLKTQINSMSILNVESTVGSFDKQALETELTQLKDAITSVRIQNDGFKLTALTTENAKLKSESLSKMHSEPIVPEKPKVLAPRMYAISSKYIVPPRRVNGSEPTPLPKKKQATF